MAFVTFRWAAVRFLSTVLAAAACQRSEAPKPQPSQAVAQTPSPIRQLADELRKADFAAQDAAAAKLEELGNAGLSTEQGLLALEQATTPFPPRRSPEFDDSAAELVRAAGKKPDPAYPARVVELFPRYTDLAKFEAFRLLGLAGTPESSAAYVEVLRRYQPKGLVPKLAIRPIQERLFNADVYYPALFVYADDPKLELNIYELCLNFFNERKLKEEKMAAHAAIPIRSWERLKPRLLHWQSRPGYLWMSDPSYQPDRYLASVLIDLLGHLPTDEVRRELRQWAKAVRDPRLQMFTTFSLLRLGEEVGAAAIERIAANPEQRRWLHAYLGSMRRLELFPKKYLSHEAQATSGFAIWTTRPTEMLRAPDAIQTMKSYVLPGTGGAKSATYFLLRFRVGPPHPLEKAGWMAGVSGPYRAGDPVNFDPAEDTFSEYSPWSSKSPAEHFDRPQREEFLVELAARKSRPAPFLSQEAQCPTEPSPHRCMIPFRVCDQAK